MSETGILNSFFNNKGFTLLELMVVMVIFGISIGAIGIAIGTVVNEKTLDVQAARFIKWIEHNRKIALIRSSTLLLQPSAESVGKFEILAYANDEWLDANLEQARLSMSDSISYDLEITDLSSDNNYIDSDTSGIFLYPDTSYTPFNLELSHGNGEAVLVVGDGHMPAIIVTEQDL